MSYQERAFAVSDFLGEDEVSMAPSAWVRDVAEADFEREVIERSHERPVVVDFWAPWCGPCRMLGPLLERLAEEGGGDFLLAKVNVDEAPGLAAHFGIDGIPAVKAFRDGRLVLEFVGLLPEPQLRQFLDRVRPSEADRLAGQAGPLEETDPARAEELYRRAAELDRDHEAARIGLARVLLTRGRDEEAAEVLERLGPGGEQGAEYARLEAALFLRRHGREFGDAAALRKRVDADPENAQLRFELGSALAAAGRYPEALEQLLAAAARDRKLAAAKVREVMVKVFHAVGVRSPLADDYRDKLSRLLY
jgi:putative thioredoxin